MLPLLVVFSNKLCLVVDALRYIKQFVNKRKVKLDSLDNFAFLVQERYYLSVDNLDSGYCHFPLHLSQYPPFEVSIYDEERKKIILSVDCFISRSS